tara:strand:+ start:4 stop:3324 length:3321 start_codon:yes stop_codon:yes gene_type:complete
MSASERRQRIAELREANPTLTELEVSDASLLRRFPRRGAAPQTETTQKTPGEVRAKALEVLRDNDVFKAQTEAVQIELVLAMDRALGIRANRAVSKEITAIRATLTQRKRAVREVEAVKRQLRQFIRRSLPKSNTYSQADINKLVRAVERVNQANYRVQVEKILQVVEKQRAKMRTAVLKKLLKAVTEGAKRRVTGKKMSKAKSLDADGQSFSAEFRKVLELAMSSTEEAAEKLQALAETLGSNAGIDALAKEAAGEKLTQKERAFVNRAAAIHLVQNLSTMSLEEVQDLADNYAVRAKESRQYLSEARKARARAADELRTKIDDAMRESNPEVYNDDGTVMTEPELDARMDAVRMYWKEGKGKGLSPRVKGQVRAAKLYYETYSFRDIAKLMRSMVDSLKHLGTFVNSINQTVYTEVFDRLNALNRASLKGYFEQQDFLTSLGYKAVQERLFDTTTMKFKVKTNVKGEDSRERMQEFNGDQLLRIYVLSLNPIQRKKLAEQGIDEQRLAEIKENLGEEVIAFGDKVVAHLSSEYYESINDVYRSMYGANLPYIENYFPTITTRSNPDAVQLLEGDFNGVFQAEFSSALKARTDMTSDIDLTAASFSSALESHIKSMEHFKAYAEGVKALNTIVNTPSLSAVLDGMGIKTMVKQSINNAVNPNSGRDALGFTGRAFNWIQTSFTGYALAYRLMQLPKQATSFVNAFPEYSFRKGGKIGWGIDAAIDIVPFLTDYTMVMLQARKYHKLFMKLSPTYRNRVHLGVAGDLSSLESGSPTRTPIGLASTRRAKALRGAKTAGALPTVGGDLAGVMGYAANYRRDIKNGMTQEEAIKRFEEYDASQQSRRPSEKSIVQQNTNHLVRFFTMFGSQIFLMINNTVQGWRRIGKDISNGRKPKDKDIRMVAVNQGLANALFVAMSNIAILLHGDDDERWEVAKMIMKAAVGLNLIYQIPLVGSGVKDVENWITGSRKPANAGVNPFSSLIWKIKKAAKEGNGGVVALQTMMEMFVLKAQIGPILALYRTATEPEEADIEEAADIIGISPSYRPEVYETGEPTAEYQEQLDYDAELDAEREADPEWVQLQEEKKRLKEEKAARKKEKKRVLQYGE